MTSEALWRTLSRQAEESGLIWAPEFRAQDVAGHHDVLQAIIAVSQAAACTRVAQAGTLAEFGARRLVLTRPVVADEDLRQLTELVDSGVAVSVVIDHYRHAELLSSAMMSSSGTAGVLIDTDIGRRTSGVRPGPDTAALGAAVAGLPRLRLDGVHVDDTPDVPLERCLSMAAHAARSLSRKDVSCPGIVTGRAVEPELLVRQSEIPVVISLFRPPLLRTGKAPDPVLTDSGIIRGCVLARPSLEWCLVSVGSAEFGSATSVVVSKPAGATILQVHDDVCSVLLSGESLDLTIGAPVDFHTGSPHHTDPR